MFDEIESYSQLLKDTSRRNVDVSQICNFTVDEFENLIDRFVPMESVATILRTDIKTLDIFCNTVYKMNFKETYKVLSGITDMLCRGTIKNLAKSGNNTALNIMAKHFMNLRDENNSSPITINFVDNVTTQNDEDDTNQNDDDGGVRV